MKRIFIWMLLLSAAYGQVADYIGISTAYESNPAWRICDFLGDFQRLGIELENQKGDFGQVFEPDNLFNINTIAEGEKQLFKKGVFSGYVAYHRQKLGNKLWVHHRNPYIGFPFLLADSSTGDLELNGIHWQLGYSHSLLENKLFLGSQLFYNVDEEMKEVFPKPIIKHRDLALSLGTGYRFGGFVQTGLNYTYFDLEELAATSKYSLDQDKTPIFFKVRGLDNPIIFRGETSEERKQTFVGHNLQLDSKISGLWAKETKLWGEFEMGRIEAVDGGAYPIDQGRMETRKLAFFAEATFSLAGKSELAFRALGVRRFYTADHPDLKIEVFEYKSEKLGGELELLLPLNPHLAMVPKLFGSSQFLKREDKFNGILDYFPSGTWGGSLEIEYTGFSKLNQSLEPGYSMTKIGDKKIFAYNTGWYYNQVTAEEEIFYGTDRLTYWLKYAVSYRFKNNRYILVDIRYQFSDQADNGYFKDARELSAGLKLEIRK
ncbi:MAG: hypothetical protein JXQ65_06250 [Candidatus Marinimicrobia bacterium]|nr:hypothetical protein [Candidatus Neomarinimicrobiota bacterium]